MFRLALALGRTVDELLRSMSSRELSEWQAYYALEPFGEERADLRAGIIAATTLNVWRAKGQKPVQPMDLMPDYGGFRLRAKMLTRRGGAAIMKSLAKLTSMLGGKVEDGKRRKPGGSVNGQQHGPNERDKAGGKAP